MLCGIWGQRGGANAGAVLQRYKVYRKRVWLLILQATLAVREVAVATFAPILYSGTKRAVQPTELVCTCHPSMTCGAGGVQGGLGASWVVAKQQCSNPSNALSSLPSPTRSPADSFPNRGLP